ncbi:MAG TPA: site-2 protease family protein, partial [Spirochaetia bacterium]|nr:site-2 protease family protein [Spirochaetia bacterium]
MSTNIQQIVLLIPAVLVGFTFHEFAHAFTAVKLGDRTPIEQGRYTLNPIAHISIFGFLLILLVGFGWAKPVQFNRSNFKHPRRDEVLVALAGPLTNLLLAIFFVLVLKLAVTLFPSITTDAANGYLIERFLVSFVWINLVLFIFNLLPVPPLDGSHLVLG